MEGETDELDYVEEKRLLWYGHVKRVGTER